MIKKCKLYSYSMISKKHLLSKWSHSMISREKWLEQISLTKDRNLSWESQLKACLLIWMKKYLQFRRRCRLPLVQINRQGRIYSSKLRNLNRRRLRYSLRLEWVFLRIRWLNWLRVSRCLLKRIIILTTHHLNEKIHHNKIDS